MRIDLITCLPDLVHAPLEQSIVGRARESGNVDLHVHDLRAYGVGKQRQIDDYPFGGGAGMVLMPEPLFRCLEDIGCVPAKMRREGEEIVFLTPDGDPFSQSLANSLSLQARLVLIAGHYKGVDQRVRDHWVTKEISIGDYVLSGGELPAMVLIDAIVRLIPGVLGDASSALTDSFQDGLLGAPVYTRPAVFEGMPTPEVLLSGNHAMIAKWRETQRVERTTLLRPDLIDQSPGNTKS